MRLLSVFDFFKPVQLYTWGFVAAAVVGAAVSASNASRTNKQNKRTQANARRRYELKAGVAGQQVEEQQQQATALMTDVTRKFLAARGSAEVVRAESGVTGNVSKRLSGVQRTKESEAKGEIAKQIDTNVVNIAQGMLADKIDTEAIVAEAESRKRNVFTSAVEGAVTTSLSFGGTASTLFSSEKRGNN